MSKQILYILVLEWGHFQTAGIIFLTAITRKLKKKSPWCLKMPCIDKPFKRKADMVVGCATHKSLDNFRASSNQKYGKGRKSHTISIKMSEAFKEQRVHIAGQ